MAKKRARDGQGREGRGLQLALAGGGLLVAGVALGALFFAGNARPETAKSSPGPRPSGPPALPSPPPGFASGPGTRPGGAPVTAAPSPNASLPPPPPSPLEGRFPRTPEGTRALAQALAKEPAAPERVALLREGAVRVGAGLVPDPRGPVALAAGEVEAFFRRALEDPDPAVRLEAIGILSNRDFAPAGPILEGFVAATPDQAARRVALSALAQAEGERAVPLLAELAARPDSPQDRLAAVEALGIAGGAPAVAALEKIAASDAPDAVRERARGLAQRTRHLDGGEAPH